MYLFSFLQVSSKQGGTDSESKVPINSRMVRARKIVHFDFGLYRETHAKLNITATSIVITMAKGTGCSRREKWRPPH